MSLVQRSGPLPPRGRAVLFWNLTVILGTAAAGCTSYVSLPVSRVEPYAAILTLNGEPLSLEDFDNDFRLMAIHYSAVSEGYMRKIKRRLSERVIDRRLLYQEALKRGVRVSRKEFERTLQAASKESPDDFPLLLKKQGATVEVWKRGILLQLHIDKLVEREVTRKIEITPEEVEGYYWSHLSETWLPEAIHARHLVVRNTLELAKARKRLAAGDPFGQVAADLSVGPEKSEGGDWGMQPVRDLSGLYVKALSALSPGEVSGVYRDGFGYHMFQLIERRPRQMRPLAGVRSGIHDTLLKEEQDFRFDQWLTGLKEKAVIQVNQEMIPLVGENPEVKSGKP
jgi:peptidyl-prolyl cis-trans isomerase C